MYAAISFLVGLAIAIPAAGNPCLNVLLFPYIPECDNDSGFTRMRQRMEREFREAHDLCVNITIADVDWALYKPEKLASFLRDGRFDVVEIDTVVLGELVGQGVLQPWPTEINTADWFDVAREASTVNGRLYGVPHLLCSHFVFSRSDQVLQATSSEELQRSLQQEQARQTNTLLMVGDASGSWTHVGLYLDAWKDTHPTQNVAAALQLPLDEDVSHSLTSLLDTCETNGVNPCLDNQYSDSTKAAELFGKGQAIAMFGYFERLHYIIKSASDPGTIGVAPASFGSGQGLLMYTDSFVIREGCSGSCLRTAVQFADYINSRNTFRWYLLGEECAEPIPPRYLIPALKSVFDDIPEVGKDRFYASIRASVETSAPLPNHGLPAARKHLHTALRARRNQDARADL